MVKRSLTLSGVTEGLCQMSTFRTSQPRRSISMAKRNGMRQSDFLGMSVHGTFTPTPPIYAARLLFIFGDVRLPPLLLNESARLTQHVPSGLRTRLTSSN